MGGDCLIQSTSSSQYFIDLLRPLAAELPLRGSGFAALLFFVSGIFATELAFFENKMERLERQMAR